MPKSQLYTTLADALLAAWSASTPDVIDLRKVMQHRTTGRYVIVPSGLVGYPNFRTVAHVYAFNG